MINRIRLLAFSQAFSMALTLAFSLAFSLSSGIAIAAGEEPSRDAAAAARQGLPDFSELVRRQGPAVVNVRVFRSKTNESAELASERSKNSLQPPREAGLGSGFVVDPGGVILTNGHVVANAEKIRVRFWDKRELPATVVGVDPLTDVAVLKVEAENLPTAARGDSSQIKVGQWVLAIGAPMGLERTATQGIISALGRALPSDSYVSFIQTDVPINPGNSGGPLFDLEGRVVGINSQIVCTSGGYMGLSFAIPINVAVAVAQQILEKGHAAHGWLGASAQELTVELAQAYGLEAPRGALITEIVPAGPAAKAGFQLGDIILAFDDVAIAESSDLPPNVGGSLPGSEHEITVLREGQVIALKARMGELGQENRSKARVQSMLAVEALALKVSDLSAATQQVLGIPGGVLVEATGDGPAATAGIQVGDMLLKLGRHTLKSAAHLRELASSLPAGQAFPLLVRRDDSALFVTVSLPARK